MTSVSRLNGRNWFALHTEFTVKIILYYISAWLLRRPIKQFLSSCNRHNKAVGGAEQSFHTLGMAADVSCPAGVSPEELAVIAEEIPLFREGGIGVYASWVHLDVRQSGKARWRS